MQISENGLRKLSQWEGVVLFAYDDFDPPSRRRKIQPGDKVHGTLTIGIGHTGADVKPGMVITEAQARELLDRDLDEFELAVSRAVKVPLSANQFDALVSFAFNVGVGNFRSSTLLKKLNKGDYASVPGELMKWTKSKGKEMAGLVNRRSAEAGLWAKGQFVKSSGTPAEKQRAPFISGNAVAVATTVGSTGVLQFVPTEGPIAYAVAIVLVAAVGFLLWKYISKRAEN